MYRMRLLQSVLSARVLCFLLALSAFSPECSAESPYWRTRPGGLASVWYQFSEEPVEKNRKGYQDFEFFIRVDRDPGNRLDQYEIPKEIRGTDRYIGYYWANQFAFAETGNGVDGYFGIQTVGSVSVASSDPKLRNNPASNQFVKQTRIAIFSIWNTLDGQPIGEKSYAAPYGHEGKGWSCKIEYPWKQGVQYGFRISETEEIDESQNAIWWQGSVVDYSTMQQTPIGKILVPNKWGRLSRNASMFTEYYSTTVNQKIGDADEGKKQPRVCQYMPKAQITIFPPVANKGTVKLVKMLPRNYGKCAGSSKFISSTGEMIPNNKNAVGIIRNITGHLEKKP